MDYEVTVSNHALEEMVLAASESFLLGNARQWESVEIHGYLWGSRRRDDDVDVEYIDVDKFSVSTSAWGDEDWVQVDKRVARIKNSILSRWTPHYHFLGMFHTHPYPRLKDVQDNRGWELSGQDERAFLSDDDLWRLSRPGHPMALVMAVTRIARVDDTICKVDGGRLEFNVGNLRYWLSAAVGGFSADREKELSTDNIMFNPYSRHVNLAGFWLDGTELDESEPG